jgi:acetyl/propionyl-CoA carboxylase alpha subunit
MRRIDSLLALSSFSFSESAGTIEWLVDEKQNFYFLEMNTVRTVPYDVSCCDS